MMTWWRGVVRPIVDRRDRSSESAPPRSHASASRPASVSPAGSTANQSDLNPKQPTTDLVRSALSGDPTCSASGSTHLTERVGWSLVWLAIIAAGVQLWGSWWFIRIAGPLSLALIITGLAGLTAAWLGPQSPSRRAQGAAMAAVVVAVCGVAIASLVATRGYDTDEAAFSHYAALTLLHGSNPYAAPVGRALQLYHVPSAFWTRTLSGGHVTQLSYPAGSFLLAVVPLAMGISAHAVDLVDVLMWVGSALLLWWLLPKQLRWVSGLIVILPYFVGYTTSGLLDPVYMPALYAAVWKWDRFGDPAERSVARWIGPIALGLACSVKQNPWLVAPFLVAGITMEARARGQRPMSEATRYVALAVGSFCLINIPFIAWQPRLWLDAVLTPFTSSAVPEGQGFVNIFLHLGPGGVRVIYLTVAAVLCLLLLLSCEVIWYCHIKRVWPFLLPVALFVAPRSFSSYFLFAIPPALLAAITTRPAPSECRATSSAAAVRRLAVPVVATLALAGILGAAFLDPPPLSVRVLRVLESGNPARVIAVTVQIENRAGVTLDPALSVTTDDTVEAFWHVRAGPLSVGPRSRAVVTLVPPRRLDAPLAEAHWVVLAFTPSPAAVSTSGLQGPCC
jgi:hypothetical protein